MTDEERRLLQRIAAEGDAGRLSAEERVTARALEERKLLFTWSDTTSASNDIGYYASITPAGRVELDTKPWLS
jgi:hypothetical protein